MEVHRALQVFVLVVMTTALTLSSPFTADDLDAPSSQTWPTDSQRYALLHSLRTLLSRRPELRQPEERQPEERRADSSPTSVASKRGGLGRCIHNCMHSGGGLNFIQCKTMCY